MQETRKMISAMDRGATGRVPWSELPLELLEEIASRLGSKTQRSEIRYFMSVCRTWRKSVPLSLIPAKLPFVPRKISFPKPVDHTTRAAQSGHLLGKTLTLVDFSVCLIRPSGNSTELPWLVTVEQVNLGKLYVRKPLSRALSQQLPSTFPWTLDMSRFHVKEVSSGYFLRNENDINDMFSDNKQLEFDDVTKVILMVNPAKSSSEDLSDYTAFVLCHDESLHAVRLGGEIVKSKMEQLCGCERPGMEEYINDIVNYKGEIYAIGESGTLYAFDYDSLSYRIVVKEKMELVCQGRYRKNWLVEVSSKLYSVGWLGRGELVSIVFHELDEERQRWKEVSSLGDDDKILFLTFDGCLTVSVEDLPGLGGRTIFIHSGCIYCHCREWMLGHEDQPMDRHRWSDDKLDLAKYYMINLDKDLILQRQWKCRPLLSEGTELYAAALWPPPQWISPVASSSSRVLDKEEDERVELGHEVVRESSSTLEPSNVKQTNLAII